MLFEKYILNNVDRRLIMQLSMRIKNIKCINTLDFTFPLERGLYAITGENGSGKSTLIACASTVFYQMPMVDYFDKPQNASITFDLDGTTRAWNCDGKQWQSASSEKKMILNGFYEGSIVFGNRFRDAHFSSIRRLDNVDSDDLLGAPEFVRKNLGAILHNDESHYKEMAILNREKAKQLHLSGVAYYYKLNNGAYISHIRMSTGESLMISILHSLKLLIDKRNRYNDNHPYIVFLDEVELALHSSALRRLVIFLKEIAKCYNLAIFFSTHSIELLREIKAQNIFYLQMNIDNNITITNPCYPAYATRNLYSDDGYGNDLVILVEDDLSKSIVERIMIEKSLMKNIRIKILPTGGWANTIAMAYDVISSNLLLRGTKLAIVLDRDIKNDVPQFIHNHREYGELQIDYLPINSLEKYLRDNLYLNVNINLLNMLNTYVFQKRPINRIIEDYQRSNNSNDIDGKALYGFFLNELRSMRKDRDDLIEIVVKYIMENDINRINELTSYLKEKIKN